MLGIGKWRFSINESFYKGDVVIQISYKDGKYIIMPIKPDLNDNINYNILEVRALGDTLYVRANTNMPFGKKTISAELKFSEKTCTALINAPYFGKFELNNGVYIGE